MSGMAQEIQQRIEADAGAGLAPGSAETPPAETPPAAGPSTPETGQQQGPPETIPYARFKEVNDRLANLKGYEELAQYGYDPDSLGRLAAFEAQYVQDPIGTVSKMIDDLDLPQELKEAFAQHATSGGAPANTPPTAGGGTQSEASGEQPAVPPDVQEAVRWVAEQKQAAEAQAAEEANSAVLDSVVAEWDRLDKESELTTPEHVKLSFISSAAATGGFSSPEQLGKMAWEANRAYRDSILGSAVNSGRPGGAPSALPGGRPAAPTPQAYRDIADASKQAIADIQAGRLPQIGGA